MCFKIIKFFLICYASNISAVNFENNFSVLSKEDKITHSCSKVLLARTSEYWNAMLRSGMKETQQGFVELPYTSETIQVMLGLIHKKEHHEKSISLQIYTELFDFASMSLDDDLKSHLSTFSIDITNEDCLDALAFALRYQDPYLNPQIFECLKNTEPDNEMAQLIINSISKDTLMLINELKQNWASKLFEYLENNNKNLFLNKNLTSYKTAKTLLNIDGLSKEYLQELIQNYEDHEIALINNLEAAIIAKTQELTIDREDPKVLLSLFLAHYEINMKAQLPDNSDGLSNKIRDLCATGAALGFLMTGLTSFYIDDHEHLAACGNIFYYAQLMTTIGIATGLGAYSASCLTSSCLTWLVNKSEDLLSYNNEVRSSFFLNAAHSTWPAVIEICKTTKPVVNAAIEANLRAAETNLKKFVNNAVLIALPKLGFTEFINSVKKQQAIWRLGRLFELAYKAQKNYIDIYFSTQYQAVFDLLKNKQGFNLTSEQVKQLIAKRTWKNSINPYLISLKNIIDPANQAMNH
jgi:hypothetical protein